MTKNRIPEILLVVLILFHVSSNALWIGMNEQPGGHDEVTHLNNALKFHDILYSNIPHKITKLIFVDVDYPPLYYLVANMLIVILGFRYVSLTATSTIFFILTLLMLYMIGTKIKNKYFGLIAAIIFSFYPPIFAYSRYFNLEIALTAMTCCSMYYLISSDYFRKTRASVLLGIFMGFGMLVKQYFPIFVMGYLLNAFIKSLKRHRSKLVIRNIIFFLILVLTLSAIFYHGFFVGAHTDLSYRMRLVENDAKMWSELKKPALFFYPYHFVFNQISITLCIFFLWGLFVFITKEKKDRFFLISWLVIPYFFFSFMPCKYPRYLMPCFPAVALITTYAICSSRRSKLVAFSFLSFFVIVQFYSVSFVPLRESLLSKFLIRRSYHLPKKDIHKVKPLVGFLKKKIGARPIIIGFIPDHPDDPSPDVFLQLKIQGKLNSCPYTWIRYYGERYNFIRELDTMDVIVYVNSGEKRQSWPNLVTLQHGLRLFNQYSHDQANAEEFEFQKIARKQRSFTLIKKIPMASGVYNIYLRNSYKTS